VGQCGCVEVQRKLDLFSDLGSGAGGEAGNLLGLGLYFWGQRWFWVCLFECFVTLVDKVDLELVEYPTYLPG